MYSAAELWLSRRPVTGLRQVQCARRTARAWDGKHEELCSKTHMHARAHVPNKQTRKNLVKEKNTDESDFIRIISFCASDNYN